MKQCIEKIDLISKFNMHTIYKDYLVLQAVCAFSEKKLRYLSISVFQFSNRVTTNIEMALNTAAKHVYIICRQQMIHNRISDSASRSGRSNLTGSSAR